MSLLGPKTHPAAEGSSRDDHATTCVHRDVSSSVAAPPEHLRTNRRSSVTRVSYACSLGSVPLRNGGWHPPTLGVVGIIDEPQAQTVVARPAPTHFIAQARACCALRPVPFAFAMPDAAIRRACRSSYCFLTWARSSSDWAREFAYLDQPGDLGLCTGGRIT